ncbi:MAG: hypothetical protein UMR38_07995 [Candidatus Izemoplasma sp.]|nr:hypothetical protein [Candidatus Izemoplasma sp.]
MQAKFGTDGIRGRYPTELNNRIAFKLGQSLPTAIGTNRLVIGMDTRESSSELLFNVISGARSAGVDVMNAGIVSTPLISLYSKKKEITGVMITASHNPYHDNGIKVFINGEKLKKHQEKAIEDYIESNHKFTIVGVGELYSGEKVLDTYLDLIDTLDLYETPLSVGIDSAHGANYLISLGVFREITQTLHQIGNEPNGTNINDGVGSTHIEAIQELVTSKNLDIGFSFDGDGDRVLVVDKEGTLYDGDQLIYIMACYLKQQGLLNNNTVVLTKMSNLGIIKALERQGIDVEIVDVGDKYVLEALKKHDYILGGENSGHIILKRYLDTGDGVLNALFILKILTDQQTTLKELTKDITFWPQKMVNVIVDDKSIMDDNRIQTVINTVKDAVQDNGKVLVRPSGTEPVIRVTLSMETEALVDQYITQIVDVINEIKEESQ